MYSHRIKEIGSPTHLNASVSLSWWNVGWFGLGNIDFDSIRWWTGNGVCGVLADDVLLFGDDVMCDVDVVDETGVMLAWWLCSGLDVVDGSGDASEWFTLVDLDLAVGVDLFDGWPGLEISLVFECSSSRSLPPLSSFNASAASIDLRCMPETGHESCSISWSVSNHRIHCKQFLYVQFSFVRQFSFIFRFICSNIFNLYEQKTKPPIKWNDKAVLDINPINSLPNEITQMQLKARSHFKSWRINKWKFSKWTNEITAIGFFSLKRATNFDKMKIICYL